MKDRLQSSSESKQLWLESIRIAVHDFLVVHNCMPSQRAITDFFPTVTPDNLVTNQEDQHEIDSNNQNKSRSHWGYQAKSRPGNSMAHGSSAAASNK
eukprot:2918835-Ditylum_brightwellii.AAC.1